MKYWKVYSLCCIKHNPITEISEEEAENLIFDSIWENVDFDGDNFDDFMAPKMILARKELDKKGVFNCGDFAVMVSDEEPNRPFSAFFDYFSICNYDAPF